MQAKTYWCTKCNRFALSVGDKIPACPIHGNTMVDNAKNSRRVEINAPIEDSSRKPHFSRVYDADETLRRTKVLEKVVSSKPIPLISNAQDEDLKTEAMMGLLLRGRQAVVSIPEPRHTWLGRLDPAWREKFLPLLENCEVAIYARRRGSNPNSATQLELDTLQSRNKRVVIYEQDS